eukprot:14602136-Alexandrium_andersonii.AAC.1
MGLWTWIAMLSRGMLSIPSQIYVWLAQHRGGAVAPLWPDVKDELAALVALSVFAEANLRVGWHPWAFMVDASWF